MHTANFKPSKETLEKLKFIDEIQREADKHGFKLFHCGSWAITAMLGHFFKELKDIDAVIPTEQNKKTLSKIVENKGFKFVAEHNRGPIEYTNGSYEIEFGSAEDTRNIYYNSALDENNFGMVNNIKLYIADPKKILQSRYDMIEAGYKKMDDTQKFIIDTIENFIKIKSKEI